MYGKPMQVIIKWLNQISTIVSKDIKIFGVICGLQIY